MSSSFSATCSSLWLYEVLHAHALKNSEGRRRETQRRRSVFSSELSTEELVNAAPRLPHCHYATHATRRWNVVAHRIKVCSQEAEHRVAFEGRVCTRYVGALRGQDR